MSSAVSDTVASQHRHHEDIPPSQVIPHLLEELGDHHELNIAFTTTDVLPIILYDGGRWHFYQNVHAMEQAGEYRLVKGHVVRVQDGKSPTLDLSVTNLVVFQWIGMLIVLVLFVLSARRYRRDPLAPPRGIQNAIEALVVYIRDEVVRPNLRSERLTRQFMPYFVGLFFFILTLNLIGLLPGMHTATGAIGTTAALAITAFLVINGLAIREIGIRGWLHHLLGGAPVYLAPIMVPIEILGLFTKPFALTVRLFANMSAGHIILLSLIGLIFYFRSIFVAPMSVGFSIFIYLLETLVCFLQAYIFTILTAVFVGLAIGDHAHEHHAEQSSS
ncbi:MAG: F0F1 ATP synthase subunit A [Bacteroidota bacterium]|nr:F0F1 ATP synthase subunit A [Candidatus Kapabacteria bacterium]MCX7936749.1 F0F1 ATP synthase subunit A [Chlorobiota bacterium]MDW8074207.1 F0F1 ATP synthase subunit A [Bacteroidota bacterium]